MANPFTIEIEDRQVIEALNRLRDKGRDMSPAMRAIAAELVSISDHAFQQEGPGWAPHAEATILSRMGRGGMKTQKGNTRAGAIRRMTTMRLLQDSGQLAASIGRSQKSGPDFAQVGSNKAYAAIHQFGGMAGRGKSVSIPARPYLPVDKSGNPNPEARESILDILGNFLGEAI